MVDTADLKSADFGRAGSSPAEGIKIAPVAQLDRASDYGFEGWEFDSSRACLNLFL